MRPLLELGYIKLMQPAFDVKKEYDKVHRAVLVGSMKYIWSSDERHELYDLGEDPDETRNLYRERPGLAAFLDQRLGAWISSFTPYAIQGEGFSFRPPDRQTREQLKSLGYIQ